MADVHALAFNALTYALMEHDVFVPLHAREAIAAAMEAAIEPAARTDEQERITRGILEVKAPCPVHGELSPAGLACWHCSFNAGLHKAARVAYGLPYPADLPHL
jgi:hypothetical protein